MDNNSFKRNKAASAKRAASKQREPARKVAGKAKRTRDGRRGLGLMKRSNGGFGRGGKHKFAGKLRMRSPPYKPMRLSWRMSKKILGASDPLSPIQAFRIEFTPQRKRGISDEFSSDEEDNH